VKQYSEKHAKSIEASGMRRIWQHTGLRGISFDVNEGRYSGLLVLTEPEKQPFQDHHHSLSS
jgi:hypothetical protein